MSTRDEDAAWQQIVENYGERPDVSDAPGDSDAADDSEDSDDAEADGSDPRAALLDPDAPQTPRTEGPEVFHLELYDEAFVPPPLPPPPVVRPERRAAWIGLVVSPALLILLSFVHYAIPPVLTGGLVVAFLASFGYLVATMEPHDPDDDGARV